MSESRTSSVIKPYLRPIASLGALVLMIELVALRVFTRTAIHIPGLERVAIGYRLVSEIGRFAFGTGIVLVVALVVIVATDGALRGRRPLASILFGFLTVAVLAAFGVIPAVVVDVATILAIVAIPFACFSHRSGTWTTTSLSPALFVAAFALSGLPTIAGEIAPEFGTPVAGMWATAEALALLAGVALLARTELPVVRRSVFVGSAAGFVVFVSLVAQPSPTEILMLWNLGLAGYFHPVVYAAAIASLLYSVHFAWTMGDRSVAIGVAFIVAGGIGLHSTIQSAAFLMGVVILSDPFAIRVPESPARADAPLRLQDVNGA